MYLHRLPRLSLLHKKNCGRQTVSILTLQLASNILETVGLLNLNLTLHPLAPSVVSIRDYLSQISSGKNTRGFSVTKYQNVCMQK